ncbi:MAG TPA: hypothetical protein PKL77_05990 [Candidatus Omnitrophota bacterium]|nr:hypothetical protein [Candidatus Omnitrophota bacterium]
MSAVTGFANGNTVVAGSWANPTYVYADDGSYTVITPAQITSGLILEVTFPNLEIPAGSTINSVLVRTQCKVSNTGAYITAYLRAMYDGADVGFVASQQMNTTSDITFDCTTVGTWTVAKLNDGKAGAYINPYRVSATSSTFSVDYIKIMVDYTPPAAPVSVNIGGTWKTGTGYVNIGGTWKTIESIKENIGGTWK